MDKIIKDLATAFGLAVVLWAAGMATMIPVVVKCLTTAEGWALFVLDEYQTAGLTAAIAGPTALLLRLLRFKPACTLPESPRSEERRVGQEGVSTGRHRWSAVF